MKKIHSFRVALLILCLLSAIIFSSLAYGAQVAYQAHIANVSWLSEVYDGDTAGLPGSGNQMEAVRIRISGFPSTFHIDY
ncbi:MAG: hypothetical protein ACMUIM_04110, partial [bacterium]